MQWLGKAIGRSKLKAKIVERARELFLPKIYSV